MKERASPLAVRAAIFGFAVGAVACGRGPDPSGAGAGQAAPISTSTAPPAPVTSGSAQASKAKSEKHAEPDAGPTREAAGLSYYERIVGGANEEDRLPLIVAMHGRGDSPEHFIPTYASLRVPARVVYPRGPEPEHDGFQWFDSGDRSDAQFGRGLRAAVPKVAAFIREVARSRPTAGRPIITGFSQGAILCFGLAVLRPELADVSVPIAGYLPLGIAPETWSPGVRAPALYAFNGDADTVILATSAQRSVDDLRALGLRAEIHRYPGVTHSLSTEELAAVLGVLDAASRAEARKGRAAAARAAGRAASEDHPADD